METRSSLHLLFYIKRTRLLKDGTAPLYLKITVNKKTVEFGLHNSINKDLWDGKNGNAFGKTKEAIQINEFINNVRYKIKNIINDLLSEKLEISSELIRSRYLGVIVKEISILDIIKEHNDRMLSLVGIDYVKGTYCQFVATNKHVRDFIQSIYNKKDLPLSMVNQEFISKFELFLKNTCHCNHNTSMNNLKKLKKIISIAINTGVILKNPFSGIKLTYKKVHKDFLTEYELNILIEKKFAFERLEQVRDAFLFSCFTGLSHADLKLLTLENIIIGIDGNKWVSIKRKKTNTQSSIPLMPLTLNLIKKYSNHPVVVSRGVLLPVLSNQNMNAYLKEIADLCGIRKNLTSHIARHTFATTVTLNNSVPIESVSKMLGHSSLEMTKIYAKLLDKRVSQDMKKVRRKYS